MRNYLSLVRPKNIILVALSQIILIYLVIHPYLIRYAIDPILDSSLAAIFILCTIMITAAGYVINDVLDIKADQINKSEKAFLGSVISFKHGLIFYLSLVLLGFGCAIYIATSIHRLDLIWIYPMASILLFLYSYQFKNKVLIGNIIVAFFTAGVSYILFFAEKDSISSLHLVDSESAYYLKYIILSFCGFSFFANLAREIVKDIEDLEGDQIVKSKTLPIVFGTKIARWIIGFISLVLLIAYFLFLNFIPDPLSLRNEIILGIIALLTLHIIITLWKCKEKKDFSLLSTLYKALMFLGLILLISISQT